MFIERKRFTLSLVLVATLLLSSVTSAQVGTANTDDWSSLKTVTHGSKLAVKLKNGKTFEGKLDSVSDTALALSVGGKPVDINRDDVFSVYEVRGKSASKATLIGLGIGAGAGAAIGAAGGDDGSDSFIIVSKSQAAAVLGVLGAGVGALTGFLIGKSGHKRVLIYKAR